MRLLPLLVFALTAQSAFAQFEAHEWGTFTSLAGSNGITQNGMYHEDEALPQFVHGFGVTQDSLRPAPAPTPPPSFPSHPCHNKGCFGQDFFDANAITQKMETPVLYFYSNIDRNVEVNVRFPEGVLTETYPAPTLTSPSIGNVHQAANGNTTFNLEILPSHAGAIPYVDGSNIYSHARNVGSNVVRSGTEEEKFLFYRGIGRFQPRISITSESGSLSVIAPTSADRPRALFLVHVNDAGEGQLMELGMFNNEVVVDDGNIRALEDHSIRGPRKGILTGDSARNALIFPLTEAGLNNDEAIAMVDTWENGYLKVPGLRLLYILPRGEADSILPLTITPAPEKLERVFVGRIEVLLDTEEQALLSQVLRERSAFQVNSLGRFAEPKLRRLRELYAAKSDADSTTLAVIDLLVQRAAHGDDSGNLN